MSNGMIILLGFALIIFVPLTIVFSILGIIKHRRERKKARYHGITTGTLTKIVHRGMDYPHILHVSYCVDGVEYQIKESAKMKSEAIRAAGIPVGQRKTFRIGAVKIGGTVTVRYDESAPQNALIEGNDGLITG